MPRLRNGIALDSDLAVLGSRGRCYLWGGWHNNASVVRKRFKMCSHRFEYPVEQVQLRSGNVLWPFVDFAEAHRQGNSFSDNQRS